MNLPDKCPLCCAHVLVEWDGKQRKSERSATFECQTSIYAGQAPRQTQSRWCEVREREYLAARVAELEDANRSNRVVMGGLSAVVEAWKDYCKRLEETGDEMADWNMNERNLGCDPELADKWQQAKEAKP